MSEDNDWLRRLGVELVQLHGLPSPEREERFEALTRDLSGGDRVALQSLLGARAANDGKMAAADDAVARLALEDAHAAAVFHLWDRMVATLPPGATGTAPGHPLHDAEREMTASVADAIDQAAWKIAPRLCGRDLTLEEVQGAFAYLRAEDPDFSELVAPLVARLGLAGIDPDVASE